jgi:hypothetical protein
MTPKKFTMFEPYFTGDPLVRVIFSYTDTTMTRMMGGVARTENVASIDLVV